ncbi:DNRLRE domain-containing protein [Streptomyces sp. NPDC048288]|uniref:DNRLRE domain-containing protein n=1 Tax=Streptomyces sp. NPDC048288 TaxID=3365529 RepID=UPI0037171FAE
MTLVATSLLSAGATVSASPQDTEPQDTEAVAARPATAATEAAARLQAVLQGRRIQVLADRTEDTSTYANPDGTLTTESYAGPIRVRQDDGSWKGIDTDLVDTGTTLEPETAPAEVEVSDGGDKDLVSVGDGAGTSFGMDWQSTLPAPDVDGDTAAYDLGHGVTLTVQALAQGFEQSILLDKAPDAVTSYRIPLDLKGLTLTQDAGSGHLLLHDTGGTVVAEASAPHMWDSSTDPASGESAHQEEITTSVETEADGGTVLVLTPDQEFLSDPELTYPVTLDPIASLAVTTDTWLATNYTDSQRSSTELKAGTYNSGSTVARSYLKFDVSQFAGKEIKTAYLSMHSYYSSTCSTSGAGVQVRRITGSWDSSTVTWDTKPASTATGAKTSTEAFGYSSDCPAARQTWQIGGIVQAWVEDGEPNYGVEVRGKSETDSTTWRRYRSANYSDTSKAPKLSVTYNTVPATPTLVAPATGSYTADTTPELSARATDGDSQSVRVTFQVYDAAGTTQVTSGTTAYKASGSTFTWSPAALAAGTYKWRALSYDGSDSSAVSGWRTLTVDTSTPAAPTVSSTAYPGDGGWHGDAGTSGDFTFTTTATTAPTVEYALDGGTAVTAALSSGRKTVSLTPSDRGVHTLTARVQNAAGTWSETAEYTFYVGQLSGTATADFAAEVAETHFSDVLHAAAVAEAEEADEDVTLDDVTEVDEDTAPADFTEEELAEVTEDEDSAAASPTLALPDDATGSVTATDATGTAAASIALPDAAGSAASLYGTSLVVYPNTQTDSDTLAVRTDENSVETFHLLRSAAAPASYSYTVALATGQTISGTDGGSLVVQSADSDVAVMIDAPAARDADGDEIPVTLTADGNVVTVALAPQAGTDVTYPVLLDPDFYGADLNNTEYKWCTKDSGHKSACIAAYGYHGQHALNKTREYAKDGYWKESSVYLGTGDAFRHCYWNARMVLSNAVGSDYAYAIATNHEATSKGNDKEMDLRNNKIGRIVGRSYKGADKPYTKVRLKCRNKATGGALWVIKNGSLVQGTSG